MNNLIRYGIGDKIKGEFKVLNIIEGGMGTVYISQSLITGHFIALKTFKKEVIDKFFF